MRILTPLAFALAGYLLIYAAFGSYISTFTGVWGLITGNKSDYISQDLTVNRLDGYTDAVPSSVITFPRHSDCFGEVRIKSAGIKAPLYFGDSDALLKKGICQYMGSTYIGSGSTVLLSGHNNTFLNTLGDCKAGDSIEVDTNYGSYVYEIVSAEVRKAGDSSWFNLESEEENLVIYTCYPFNALGITNFRYVVSARYVSGPRILYDR